MAGGVRPIPAWPPPPNVPGALERGGGLLGWLGVPGHLPRGWAGTVSGPFVPVLAQPDCGRAEPSSDRDGRSSGGGVRPGAPLTPALARPIAVAPAPGLTV
jgi:hypothetical protein